MKAFIACGIINVFQSFYLRRLISFLGYVNNPYLGTSSSVSLRSEFCCFRIQFIVVCIKLSICSKTTISINATIYFKLIICNSFKALRSSLDRLSLGGLEF